MTRIQEREQGARRGNRATHYSVERSSGDIKVTQLLKEMIFDGTFVNENSTVELTGPPEFQALQIKCSPA